MSSGKSNRSNTVVDVAVVVDIDNSDADDVAAGVTIQHEQFLCLSASASVCSYVPMFQ